MTFFEQELKHLFENDTTFTNKRFVGNTCYGRLDNNIRVKIQFTTCGIADHYQALKVTLLNRNEGEIDSMTLHFHDMWGMKRPGNPNIGEKISPYIWKYEERTEWYIYKPTRNDYQKLADAVRGYLVTFQEPIHGQQLC
ncbi:MAG: hypothetical protein LUK37_06090 [Clostridia bacterium]|nr:hypothetical protein [Clostridia bacterium]